MEQEERTPKGRGMQFVSQMTKSGDYFFIRIPTERNQAAKKYFDSKKYLLVRFNEIEVSEE
jgi:hypothetical protein